MRLYDTLRIEGKDLEIVFVSFDRDEDKFNEHVKCMPWLAVPFDVNLHKRLSDMYHVDRIPSLIPLSSDGIGIEEDLIGLIEDYGAEAFPFTRKRREELKAIDDAKREGGKIEELLAHQGRNYLMSRDGREVYICIQSLLLISNVSNGLLRPKELIYIVEHSADISIRPCWQDHRPLLWCTLEPSLPCFHFQAYRSIQ